MRIQEITVPEIPARRQRESQGTETRSEGFDFKDLAAIVVSAGWAGDVRRHSAAALGAGLEDRSTPAGGATAHFLSALRLTALRNGHGGRELTF